VDGAAVTTELRTRSGCFAEAMRYVLDLEERGLVSAISAHLDPTGVGRISFTTMGGADLDLTDLPGCSGYDDTDKE
jgi:hypothetical protein